MRPRILTGMRRVDELTFAFTECLRACVRWCQSKACRTSWSVRKGVTLLSSFGRYLVMRLLKAFILRWVIVITQPRPAEEVGRLAISPWIALLSLYSR